MIKKNSDVVLKLIALLASLLFLNTTLADDVRVVRLGKSPHANLNSIELSSVTFVDGFWADVTTNAGR